MSTNTLKKKKKDVHLFLSVSDVCLKDTMSVADSLYNLQLIKEFCEGSLQNCCPLAVEDLLYAPPLLHVSVNVVDSIGRKQINSINSINSKVVCAVAKLHFKILPDVFAKS